jgi:hypothetical protein
MSGEFICVDYGSYNEPPTYDVDWQEIITVQPKLKCWGRGINNT